MLPRSSSSRPRPQAAPSSLQQGRMQPSLSLGSPSSDLFQGVTHGVATTVGVGPIGGGGLSLPLQAPPPPRFRTPPRYDEIWPGGHSRPSPPPPRLGLPHPRPSQPPYSGVHVSEVMEEQTPSEALDPLSHEASGSGFSKAWSVGDEECLHMRNFDSMEQE